MYVTPEASPSFLGRFWLRGFLVDNYLTEGDSGSIPMQKCCIQRIYGADIHEFSFYPCLAANSPQYQAPKTGGATTLRMSTSKGRQ